MLRYFYRIIVIKKKKAHVLQKTIVAIKTRERRIMTPSAPRGLKGSKICGSFTTAWPQTKYCKYSPGQNIRKKWN